MKTLSDYELQSKEFLSVPEACQLAGISRRTFYRIIQRGQLKPGKIGRRTILKRAHLDKVLKPQPPPPPPEPKKQAPISERNGYTITEVLEKYNISSRALCDIIRRNHLEKIQQGRFVYVSKEAIDQLFQP